MRSSGLSAAPPVSAAKDVLPRRHVAGDRWFVCYSVRPLTVFLHLNPFSQLSEILHFLLYRHQFVRIRGRDATSLPASPHDHVADHDLYGQLVALAGSNNVAQRFGLLLQRTALVSSQKGRYTTYYGATSVYGARSLLAPFNGFKNR